MKMKLRTFVVAFSVLYTVCIECIVVGNEVEKRDAKEFLVEAVQGIQRGETPYRRGR